MRGVLATVVKGGEGQALAGAAVSPTKTMFQLDPCQLVRSTLRVRYCCCEPLVIWVSMSESAMNPPLDQPPLSSSTMDPRTCARRSQVPCDTAQTSLPSSMLPEGAMARFSAARQKLQVALSLP